MELEKMIEQLNEACGETLSIIYYTSWQVSSYGNETPLNAVAHNATYGKTFAEAVEKAYHQVFGGKQPEGNDGKE